MYSAEHQAKQELETVYINGEPHEFDRWTLTQIKAMAYDQGISHSQVLCNLIEAANIDDLLARKKFEDAEEEAARVPDMRH